ncbi:MBL fold metallo-hydrolase [Exilibacterium tricleocarpae]|uniref:Ribonuclease Z n=1 Tax=Exilibacterium tricleocarpae TaxID=2591008 RepID=A0A545TNI7_9GAMM|nr:MBL fold metallo-hydrolase [Exilibacterium tricleocarpae]TQV78731.1 MBL fold metallo-hydrolase [Exilibacterium tricleocarpae]
MEFMFLGTSSGVPTRHRNVSGLAIGIAGAKAWYLVDCGEGTQHRLLQTHRSLVKLAGIFITHVHGDHCFGLPGLLASAAMAGRSEPLPIIAPEPIRAFIEIAQKTTDTYIPYDIIFTPVEEPETAWRGTDMLVKTTALSHRVPSYAYTFTERYVPRNLNTQKLKERGVPAGPLWGRLQKGQDVTLDNGTEHCSDEYLLPQRSPRSIVIGGDNDTPELLSAECAGADVLVHEATYTEAVAAVVGSKHRHSSAAQVAGFAQRVGLRNLVLTHFSARYQIDAPGSASVNELEHEARAYYDGNLFLADDLAGYELDKGGNLQLKQPGLGSGRKR